MVMVANDVITADSSYLDVDSITIEGTGQNSTADIIAKAIMWNHGFGASDMVLRSFVKTKPVGELASLSRGLSDAAKMLNGQFRWTVGGSSHIKHGNIVALSYFHEVDGFFFLRLKNGEVDFGGGRRRSAADLPRSWSAEFFLVIQKGDKFAFYSLNHSSYMREFEQHLDGKGGDVHLDPPRFCELFTVEAAKNSKIRLKMPSGGYACADFNRSSGSVTSTNQISTGSRFKVVSLCDAFSNEI